MAHTRGKKRNCFVKGFAGIGRARLNSPEWKGLSAGAKILYLHLKGAYIGTNNGDIVFTYGHAKGIKGISSPGAFSRVSKELQQKEWIKVLPGGLYNTPNKYTLTGRYDESVNLPRTH